MYIRALVLALFMSVMSCSNVKVEDYAANQPSLNIKTFFNGNLSAQGVVKNRSGKVIRYFNATIKASWENDIGTLDEQFIFDDGEEQQRVWTLVAQGENSYEATAEDVIGPGQANIAGNSMFLQYILRTPYNNSTIDLTVDDRMYLVNDSTLMNESQLYKFGFRVGSILLTITK